MLHAGAVICEFNPMHLGHSYILQKAREHIGMDCCLIAVMSGNFTERGTPAVYDKYLRARTAVLAGADIVAELPFPWCSSGAETFALGGVSVAVGLGCSSLVFGSESGDMELIARAARVKGSEEFVRTLKKIEREDRALGAAESFSRAMTELGVRSELGANDKLGSEYLLSGERLGMSDFYAVRREEKYMSAGELRERLFSCGLDSIRDYIPPFAYESYFGAPICREERYNDILFAYSRLGIKDGGEVLRFARSRAEDSADSTEFMKKLSQKRLTRSRIRRALLFSLIGAESADKKAPPMFTVLLAANERGRQYLKETKKSRSICVVTKPSDAPRSIMEQYETQMAADRLYTLCEGERADRYMRAGPVML